MRRGLVLGSGGVLGFTWMIARLARYARDTGWDPRTAEQLIGTSAGSVLAALLAAGRDIGELYQTHRANVFGRLGPHARRSPDRAVAPDAYRPPARLPSKARLRPQSPRLTLKSLLGRAPWTAGLVGLMPFGRGTGSGLWGAVATLECAAGWVDHPGLGIVAMDLESGERVAFGRADAPPARLVDAVAASCAVPGIVPPVIIGDRAWVDGGVISPTSADLLAGADLDEVVVLAPMTSARFAPPRTLTQAAERVMRAVMSRTLNREVRLLEERGARVIRLEPSAHELSLWGGNFLDHRHQATVLSGFEPQRADGHR